MSYCQILDLDTDSRPIVNNKIIGELVNSEAKL